MRHLRRLLPAVLGAAMLCGTIACGPKEPPAPPPVAPKAELATCVVEGTPFVPGRGVKVTVAGTEYEVCSNGCAIRLATTPERFLKAPK